MYVDAWTTAQARSQEIQWQDLREAVHRTTPSQLALLDAPDSRPLWMAISKVPWNCTREAGRGSEGMPLSRNEYFVRLWHHGIVRSRWKGRRSLGSAPHVAFFFTVYQVRGKHSPRAVSASSLGLNVVKVRASDVLDQWLGGSEAAIRSLFHRARGAQPCILYFDEIDAIASNREQEGTESDVSSRILTTLLNEMDGISSTSNTGVLVLACTNRMQDLDAALLRPGRLEEHIELTLPTTEDLREIPRVASFKGADSR
jgi:SpoVK/Ycf46/Vps4 family AAA+-type ATPase